MHHSSPPAPHNSLPFNGKAMLREEEEAGERALTAYDPALET